MDPVNVRAVVSAAREVTHTTSNLASVTGHVLLEEAAGDVPTAEVTDAMAASSAAAKAAFILDDVYRAQNGSDASLRVAESALAAAEVAVRAAREALAEARRTVSRRARLEAPVAGGGEP